MEILPRAGKATAVEVMEALPAPPSYSVVRSILRVLGEKGHIRHEEEGKRYPYLPAEPRNTAARSALLSVVRNFFGGSLESAVKTFRSDRRLSDDELARMAETIEHARKIERA